MNTAWLTDRLAVRNGLGLRPAEFGFIATVQRQRRQGGYHNQPVEEQAGRINGPPLLPRKKF